MPLVKRQVKTHCLHGHKYTPDSTRYNGHGGRYCTICQTLREKRKWAQLKARRKGLAKRADETDPAVLLCREEYARVKARRDEQKAAISAEVQKRIAYPWSFRESLGYIAPRKDDWAA